MYILPVFVCSLLASAAAPVLATPVLKESYDREHGHVTVLKRDVPLSPRDLELAAMHGVDIEKMFRHSIVKRSEDEEWTVWVHNSFQNVDSRDTASGLERRDLSARPLSPFFTSARIDMCAGSSFDDETTKGSPTTGGTQEMERWARRNNGFFDLDVQEQSAGLNVDLVVAGSNTGSNSCFLVRKHPLDRDKRAWVGSQDIGDIARDAMARFQRQIDGKWKMGAHGGMRCSPFPFWGGLGPKVDWWIAWTSQRA